MAVREDALNPPSFTLRQKLWQMHWLFILLLGATASVGFAMLYSAAGGNIDPWASRQMVRFAVGMAVLITVALIDIRLWLKYAYVFYLATVALLFAVEVMGEIGKGAQRWLDLGYFGLQPSELMKIALVLALARYFHGRSIEDVRRLSQLVVPLFLIAVPAALAASCSFMLPVGTPPNAIVFGSGKFTLPQMARAGVWLNIGFLVLIVAMAYWLAPIVFGIQHGVVPDWAA